MRQQLDLLWTMPVCTLYGEFITAGNVYEGTYSTYQLAKTAHSYIESELALQIH